MKPITRRDGVWLEPIYYPVYFTVTAEVPAPELDIEVLSGGVGSIVTEVPAPVLVIALTPISCEIVATVPSPTLLMEGGAWIGAELPTPLAVITATTAERASILAELPEPVLAITAVSGGIASLVSEFPAPTFVSYGGGFVAAEVPAPTLTLTVTARELASISAEIPAPLLSISVLPGGISSISAEIPAPTLAITVLAGGVISVAATVPAPALVVYAGTTVAETTYAINLNTGAVTQLLLGAFDKLVTAHGRLYGLRSGALVRLDGGLDGAATIPATIRFAPQQFGTLLAKRIDGHVYLNLRENDGVTLTVVQDETTSWDYQTPTDNAPGIGTHRVKVGRGITFHSIGLTMKNRNGGRLDVGGLEIPVHPLSRKPR